MVSLCLCFCMANSHRLPKPPDVRESPFCPLTGVYFSYNYFLKIVSKKAAEKGVKSTMRWNELQYHSPFFLPRPCGVNRIGVGQCRSYKQFQLSKAEYVHKRHGSRSGSRLWVLAMPRRRDSSNERLAGAREHWCVDRKRLTDSVA